MYQIDGIQTEIPACFWYPGCKVYKLGPTGGKALMGPKALEKVNIFQSGKHEVKGDTFAVAAGNSVVRAFDKTTVRAYDNSQVWAHNDSVVTAYGNAHVSASGNSTVTRV